MAEASMIPLVQKAERDDHDGSARSSSGSTVPGMRLERVSEQTGGTMIDSKAYFTLQVATYYCTDLTHGLMNRKQAVLSVRSHICFYTVRTLRDLSQRKAMRGSMEDVRHRGTLL